MEIAATVYINPDLTPAEAELAYERRQKRRAARQKLVTAGRAPDQTTGVETVHCSAQCRTVDGTGNANSIVDSGSIISSYTTSNVKSAQVTAVSHGTVTTTNTCSHRQGENSNTKQDYSVKSPFPSS